MKLNLTALEKYKNTLFFPKCNHSRKVFPQIYLQVSIKLSGYHDYNIISIPVPRVQKEK